MKARKNEKKALVFYTPSIGSEEEGKEERGKDICM
jgi:hypothetical protein